MADGGAHAVRARVAAADDENALVLGADGIRGRLSRQEAVLSAEELKGEVNAGEFTTGNRQVACGRRADRDDDRVVRALQVLGRDVSSDFGVGLEHDALRLEDLPAAVDDCLVELEAGDAVAEESADVVVLLVDGDRPALAPQRDRGGEPGRASTDDGGALAVLLGGRTRDNPAVCEGRLDDQLLALPDHHRLLVELVDAAGFAERRADARGELREVAVDGQKLVGLAEVAVGDGAVLVRHEVSERTAVAVAEGNATGEAALDLGTELVSGQPALDFVEIDLPLFGGTVVVVNAFHDSVLLDGDYLDELRAVALPVLEHPLA